MSVTQTKWLLRLGLPLASYAVALLCGRSAVGAVGIVFLTALLVVIAAPLTILGIIFMPILGLYGLKFSSRKEPDMDLRDPDIQLFLFLGIPATLAAVGLFSLHLKP